MNNNLPWHDVEKSIHKEITWLKNVIDTQENLNFLFAPEQVDKWSSYYFIYRLIAIAIVRGDIKAREINAKNNQDLWDGLTKTFSEPSKAKHGQDWHKRMIDILDKYFTDQDYEVSIEPNLFHGRADLGIHKKGKKNIYIEVGKTSIYKLCVNLLNMKECIILLVPLNNKVIEFEL